MGQDNAELIAEAHAEFHDQIGNLIFEACQWDQCYFWDVATLVVDRLVAELERVTPREVTTIAELEALPVGSAILIAARHNYPASAYIIPERSLFKSLDSATWAPDRETAPRPMKETWLPATVLFTPTGKETE